MQQKLCSQFFKVAVAGFFSLSATAQAAEVSLLSGFYRSEDDKVEKASAGGKTEISVGGRFSEPIQGHLFWFGQGDLALRSYRKGDRPAAPGDSTSLTATGGVRWYFNKLSEVISPFAEGYGAFQNDKDATFRGNGFSETEKNGLYYGASFGIRFSLQKEFFVDFSTNLFESALFATEKTEETSVSTANGTTTTTTTTSEHKKTELYVNSRGFLQLMTVGLGMRL